ncbi:hypothetical protein JZ751_013177 [Albula glossodonta]|uniref:Uncharacterized protein n=1 Tax=Albula glossodonta TaxID=121402 RepID=A0A8T2NWB3_9TELE|nr:hypothetical protein JZ751_013177 [Albula glossodonta]
MGLMRFGTDVLAGWCGRGRRVFQRCRGRPRARPPPLRSGASFHNKKRQHVFYLIHSLQSDAGTGAAEEDLLRCAVVGMSEKPGSCLRSGVVSRQPAGRQGASHPQEEEQKEQRWRQSHGLLHAPNGQVAKKAVLEGNFRKGISQQTKKRGAGRD